jgi:hypothetical protein
MSKSIFVINEISFEYNDEYYHTGESEGGQPVQAYSTKAKAEAAISELTKEWVKEHSESEWSSITDYSNYDESVLDVYKFSAKTGIDVAEIDKAFENYDTKKINEMVKNNIDAAAESLTIKLFKVVEVELA